MRVLSLVLLLLSFVLVSPARGDEAFEPPVPSWRPEIRASNEAVLDRMRYYTDQGSDLVIFAHGTTVILPDGLTDEEAVEFAHLTLEQIVSFHPDMRPMPMDDGNMLVGYNHPAYNVVIESFVSQHMDVLRTRHLDGLAPAEVLIGPNGQNVFDEFGMKALYGRALMFMDAQVPEVVILHRH